MSTFEEVDVTSSFLWLVILGGFVCFAMSWGIGANDVANAFATSVGAKAVTLKQAVVIAAIFEFAGAVGLGANVTSTIRKKITKFDLFEGEEDVLMLGMFCSLLSAALWLFIATKNSLPVSTTHAIIGAIIGFSVAAKGLGAVEWAQVAWIILFWIIAPLMAVILTMALFAPLRSLILRKPNSYQLALRWWWVFVFIVAFIMCFFLIIKGLQRLDFDYEAQTGLAFGLTFGISAVVAILSYLALVYSGAVNKYVEKCVEKEERNKYTVTETQPNVELVTDEVKRDIESILNNTESIMNNTESANVHTSQSKASKMRAAALKGVEVDIYDDMEQLEVDIHNNSEKFDFKTEKSFAWLQVCTASLCIFAHGSNDVANAVAPFAAMVGLYQSGISSENVAVPEWILVIGALGMVMGLSTYGYKIMKCLGVRMCYITSSRGYCIELSSAVVIIICSVLGYPASTTHAQVGATVGAGILEKVRKNATLKWRQVINWKLLAQVFFGWILTLVFTGLTSGIIFALLAYSPYAGEVPKNCNCDDLQ